MSVQFTANHPLVREYGSVEMVKLYIRSRTKREFMEERGLSKASANKYQSALNVKFRPECNKCGTTDETMFRADKTGKIPNGLCVNCVGVIRPRNGVNKARDPNDPEYEFDGVESLLEAARKPMSSAQGGLSYWAQMGAWVTGDLEEMPA